MFEVIVKQIEEFIEDIKEDKTKGSLYKTQFVAGYRKALDDVSRIISTAKALSGDKTDGT